MVREQAPLQTAVGMTPARRPAGGPGFDARAALAAIGTPVLALAPDGRIEFVNAAAEALLVVRVTGDPEGRLVVELESGVPVRRTPTGTDAHVAENAALRALARQM